ncbi:MAG TPA: hypothetical protein ENK12_01040, partial [Gammaproteobacteria bacterium]|nr:hypothetical protein [Gammaproteobacteria bacterium]
MNTRLSTWLLAASLMLPAAASLAVENITLNGFLTVGATKSNSTTASENGNITDDVGFDEDSRVGIQISADINDRMSVTAQLLGRADRNQNFDAEFDWGFVSYALGEDLTVRGGKLKFPTFLVSEYIEVGYAYPWIRPPAEVYASNPIT